MKSSYFRFRITPELKKDLEKSSKRLKLSQSEFVRRSIEAQIKILKKYGNHGS